MMISFYLYGGVTNRVLKSGETEIPDMFINLEYQVCLENIKTLRDNSCMDVGLV